MGFPKDPAIFGNISPSKEVGSVALHNEGEVAEGLLCELGGLVLLDTMVVAQEVGSVHIHHS